MKTLLRTLSTLGMAALLAACSFNTTATPAPTSNIEPTLNAARTEAASTVAAAIAAQPTATDLPATSTITASKTPLPTNTAVPAINTPTTKPQSTNTPVAPTATLQPVVLYTSTPIAYGCSVTASSTTGDSKKAPGSDFDARWTVKNTGTSDWARTTTDYKYSSGTKMQKSVDAYDVKTAVAVGDSIDLVVDMIAPTNPGTYRSTWVVSQGSNVLCSLPVVITVK